MAKIYRIKYYPMHFVTGHKTEIVEADDPKRAIDLVGKHYGSPIDVTEMELIGVGRVLREESHAEQ